MVYIFSSPRFLAATDKQVFTLLTGFVDDFTIINEKLDNIYDEVDAPLGWFLVENILRECLKSHNFANLRTIKRIIAA
jgi:hypothetical protein